ncbi:CDP-glycerol glycerophosphotransferase family protein [Enterococcus sp. N249-2]
MKNLKLFLLKKMFTLFYVIFKKTGSYKSKRIVLATNRNPTLFAGMKNIENTINKYSTFEVVTLTFHFERNLSGRINYFFKSIQSIYYLATSRFFIVDDYFFPIYCIKKSKENSVIQIWHAIGHLKKFGLSIPENKSSIIKHHSNYDYAIVNSVKDIPFYAEAFGMEYSKVIAIGNPKIDGLFQKNEEVVKNKRLKILYAPTYRKDNTVSIQLIQTFIDSATHLLDIYDIYISVHPYVKIEDIDKPEKFIIFQDGNISEDILSEVDLLITDYSSISLEYSFFEKPLLIYAPDIENYTKQVGFYVDYKDYIEAPIFMSISELIRFIDNGDYLNDIDYIYRLKQKVFDYFDGCNSERFYQFLVEKAED